MKDIYLSTQTTLIITLGVGAFFIALGYVNLKKVSDKKSYIIGDRNESIFSLTTSLSASALGAWILFGPASAATWGGIGAVIGYALGTAAPMLFLLNFGPKIRKEFPNGMSLTEFVKRRFGTRILKIILILILFYLTIFLIAEVTAIAFLLNLISKTPLWITSGLTLIICLLYILRGGFKLSIITDKYQFLIVLGIILFSIFLILGNLEINSYELIKKNSTKLVSRDYIPNYTAGLTFFIAVAATNLFHQGNWQRVFAARNNLILKKSLIYSSIISFLIVLWMGYTGLISFSIDPKIIADLAFFKLMLLNNNVFIIVSILVLALALTLSTIDTLINAISSLIIIDGKEINKFLSGREIKNKSNKLILLLCVIVFVFASKGYSILYLFLFADLLCCAAVVTVFYGFFNKKINTRLSLISIILGLSSGLLFFPSQNFQSSLLVGNIMSVENFSPIILSNLLFISFILALIVPLVIITTYSLRNSLR
ncbi:sodium:solute symporter [Candidatus Pelagibacter bacterium]|nr:sodium:solute symporter [Candidatus Pelagibacter bacterium]